MVMDLIKKMKIFGMLRKIKKRIITTYARVMSNRKKIKKYKDSCNGKRCFIIGNGPSLSIEDLEKLKDEDCFATNRIYRIFDKTSWRPKYYFSQDTKRLEEALSDLGLICEECENVFLNSMLAKKVDLKLTKKINFFYVNIKEYFPNLPEFSLDFSKCAFEGFTVVYACIQAAVYMGYSEIYLLGLDHSYNISLKANGEIEKDAQSNNYMKGLEGSIGFLPQLEKTTLAYRKAKEICLEKSIIIKNVTRGGKLEEFIRVDLDRVLEE